MESDLLAAIDSLRISMRELAVSVDGLSERSDVQEEVIEQLRSVIDQLKVQGKRGVVNRIIAVVALVGLAIGLGLTAWQGVTASRVSENTRSVQAVQERTSTEVLCPLYLVFVNSIKHNPAPPNLPPDEVKFRAEAAKTIEAGLHTLGCKAQ